MNILLTTSAEPHQSPFSTNEKRPPIGIGFLISILKDAGHKVFFIDNYLQPTDFLNNDYLQKNEIRFVGIHANTICFRDTLRMLYRIEYFRRTDKWNGKIVVGGPHTTVALDTIPEFVDFVVQGEGEQAIVDIVSGKVTERVVRYPRLHDLDKLPMPAWEYFISLPYDWSIPWFDEQPVFTMNTSRGCPFKCSFCSVSSIWGGQHSHFSAERIVSDIEYLIENFKVKGIYFREDNFTINRKRLVKFCNLLIEKKVQLPWVCESRVDTLDKELIELMYRAGARAFYFGVEAGSQRILDFLQKGITIEQTRNVFKLCHEFGIKTAASVIVGVPTETEKDVLQTMALLAEIQPTVIWYNVFVGIPNSKLYQYVLNKKIYEFIDDRGLLYLKKHNALAKRFYNDQWNAYTPITISKKKVSKPQISVIMAAYNCSKYVERAVKSILAQTFQNFELIIINDASTDNTADILKTFNDPRISIITNSKNLGPAKSRNKAIKLARGEYIAIMDADDISLPHRFEVEIEFLDKNPEFALIGSSYYQIDENDKIFSVVKVLTDNREIKRGLKAQNWFGHSSVMMRKDVLFHIGGYDGKYKYAHDYNLFLKIAEVYKVANIEEPLYCWRSTPSSISKKKEAEQKYYANLAVSEATKRAEQRMLKRNTGSSVMVSVIVPTYNRPDMLIETLKSILHQTYKDFEIIVVNDAGIDVESMIKLLNKKNSIIYLAHAENRGLAAARDTGIKAARGKYIAYLDDDDIFYPDHLETLVNFLENNEYKVAYTDAYRVIQEKQNSNYVVIKKDILFSLDFDYDRILVENFVPILCLMHERSCLEEVGLFDEKLTVCEDWDFMIRISRKFKIAHLKKVTSEYSWRIDGTNMISGRSTDFGRTFKIIYEKHRAYSQSKPALLLAQMEVIASFIDTLEKRIKEKEEVIESIYSSRTWKIGRIATVSWRILKKFFHLDLSKST